MTIPTTSTWQIDPGHSAIQFKIKHLAIANVVGAFTAFAGTLQTDRDDFAEARVHVEIEAASLSTNHALRDTHLQSDIFLDVLQFPTLTFSGTLHKTADAYALTGALTIRGITKTVTLPTVFTGTGTGRAGDTRAGFEVTGSLSRADFGLTWNMLTEMGSLIVGEHVRLQMDMELLQEAVPVAAATT